jgi:hypothetical protein
LIFFHTLKKKTKSEEMSDIYCAVDRLCAKYPEKYARGRGEIIVDTIQLGQQSGPAVPRIDIKVWNDFHEEHLLRRLSSITTPVKLSIVHRPEWREWSSTEYWCTDVYDVVVSR